MRFCLAPYNVCMDTKELLYQMVLTSYKRIGCPRSLVCGLSAGADSVCLMLILHALRQESSFVLSCVHVNHGLRAASEAEEAFVLRLCNRLDIPLDVVRVEVRREGNLESNARDARYRAYDAALRKRKACTVALAHHADDQAETLLMHLMRGSGGAGLAGMREYRAPIWRPLLQATREEIRKLLLRQGEAWCEDESNLDERYLRNALRQRVLPPLKALSALSSRHMARAASLLADEEDFWAEYVSSWLFEHASITGPCPFLLAEPCARLPVAAQRRVLRALCHSIGKNLSFDQTEALRRLLDSPARACTNLPGGGQALRTEERLHLPPARNPDRAPPGRLLFRADSGDFGDGKRIQALDARELEGATLRFRLPGDRITPLHAKGSQPLKEYLINRRVDRPFRAVQPLVARGNRVLWVIGVGVAQTAAITEATERRCVLVYEGRLPSDLECQADGAGGGKGLPQASLYGIHHGSSRAARLASSDAAARKSAFNEDDACGGTLRTLDF